MSQPASFGLDSDKAICLPLLKMHLIKALPAEPLMDSPRSGDEPVAVVAGKIRLRVKVIQTVKVDAVSGMVVLAPTGRSADFNRPGEQQ